MEKILEVKGLSAGYGKKAILQAADFTVYAGEMIGIIGANGSGKSTLLKTLRGLLPPLRGHILYTGRASNRVGYFLSGRDFSLCTRALCCGKNHPAGRT